MKGRIIKGIAGFYYVFSEETGLVECHAKGIFRKEGKKPLVGDYVEFVYTEEEEKRGSITSIYERKNELLRPNVSNADQALVIFAVTKPEPNLNLLDRFLMFMEQNEVETLICFNKRDLVTGKEEERLRKIYEPSGYPILFLSAKENAGIEAVKAYLRGKTTVLAGPSGVGKSTLCNRIYPEAQMETGGISQKIARGKHTTRHSELIYIGKDSYLVDTPGFTSLLLPEVEKEDISKLYREMQQMDGVCRFRGCVHINEPGCAVKEALEEGKISIQRYENYKLFYEEAKNRRKYK